MKKLILNLLLLSGIGMTAAAQAYDPVPMAVTPANQPENNALQYASQNIYANEVYKSYWVWDKTSVSWVKRVELVIPAAPITVPIVDPRYKIPLKGDDVCTTGTCSVKPATKPGG